MLIDGSQYYTMLVNMVIFFRVESLRTEPYQDRRRIRKGKFIGGSNSTKGHILIFRWMGICRPYSW